MSECGEAAVEVVISKPASCAQAAVSLDEVTESGLWTPSRKGKLITVQQWRVLDGNLKFCYNGRVMYGPGNWYWWIFVVLHLLLTTLVFIWFDVWPLVPSILSFVTISGSLFLLGLAIYSSLQVVFTDPGYVLRPDVEERVENLVNYHADKKPDVIMTKILSVNGKTETCTFCEICCVYRPQRAQHCEVCDCCIERYDRHCPTFGVCIGLRNVGAYIRFLFFTLCTFQVIQTVALKNVIESIGESGWSGLLSSPTLYVMLISILHPPYGLLKFSWILLTLLYNLMRDRTHYEAINKLSRSEFTETGWKARTHVFWVNFSSLVLTSQPKSHIKPKSFVKTKAIKRVPQQKLVADVSRRPRSFLSYSMARGDVPVTRASNPRRKFTSNLRRLFHGCRSHIDQIPRPPTPPSPPPHPRFLINFQRRSRRVMDHPENSQRPRQIIFTTRRAQPNIRHHIQQA